MLPGGATAHANYVSSNPFPDSIFPYNSTPKAVNVTLSEAIESSAGTIRVTNSTGARFDLPPVSLSSDGRTMSVTLSPTGAGIFTVAWTAVSAVDGHFTAGSFAYGVQDPNGSLSGTLPSGQTSGGAPVSPIEVGLRFVGFAGLAAALGASVLGAFMWIPAGRDPDVKETPAYRLGFQILMNVARAGAFGFALAFAGLFLLTDALEGSAGAGSVVGSPYKLSVVLSLGVGAVLFVVLSSAFMRSRNGPPESVHRHLLVGALLGFAAIGIGSAGTHAAAVQSLGGIASYFALDPSSSLNAIAPALGTFADAAHIAGVGLWVGGLATILATRTFLREPASVPLARIVIGRFSRMALYCVGLVLFGGLTLAVLLVGSWDALLSSNYGWVVLAKVADQRGLQGVGRRTVLVLAALLAALTPGVSILGGAQPFSLSDTVSGIHVQMLVDPPPTIANQSYTIQFLLTWASNGSTYNFGKQNSTITFQSLTNPLLPPETLPLDGPHGNHYFLTTLAMSQPGTWSVQARIARFDGFDLFATFHIALAGGS